MSRAGLAGTYCSQQTSCLPADNAMHFLREDMLNDAMQVMRKNDLIRKNMVESVRNERNILAMANNPFVVSPQTLHVSQGSVQKTDDTIAWLWAILLR
jgi:hypothetical protein